MTDIPPDQQPSPEVGNIELLQREPGVTDSLTEQELQDISQRLGSLVLEENTVLREHQVDAFEDIVQFYKDGGRECYVQLPTSTGKTVLFVEITKNLIQNSPEDKPKPRVIVLVPNIDLVDQTVGSVHPETGKKRGFKGFAPELEVRGFHSKIANAKKDKNILEAEVLVTTYNSFRNLISSFALAETKSLEEWDAEQTNFRQIQVQATRDLNVAINARNRFIRDLFEQQEVARLGRDADRMLAYKQSYTGLTDSQMSVLSTIVELSKSEFPHDVVINKIKRLIKTYISPDTKAALKSMISLTERKRGPKITRRDPDEEVELIDVATAEENVLEHKELSDFDTFITKFIWRHRTNSINAQRLFLNNINWSKMRQMNSQIEDLNSTKIHMKNRISAIDRLKILKATLKQFDLMICDEAHRAIGSETWTAIREFSLQKNIAILGLTATDEYEDRKLTSYFEDKAHELTKQEAMKNKIINPLAVFVHETGLQFEGVGIDADGDYDRATIRQMRFSEERNKIGVDYAAMLSVGGYRGVMSAIPGDGGAHAKDLAKLLNEKQIVDPKTGELRNLKARYVLNDTPKELRQEYYDQLEKGEIDWLTFVDVIREGWDSDNAKAIVNMRPTRSKLLATQRLGRIGRTFDGAPISIAIDLYDGLVSDENFTVIPPVLASDVFDLDDVAQGEIIGGYDGRQDELLNTLRANIKNPITSYHSRYVKMLESAFQIGPNGEAISNLESGKSILSGWKTFGALQNSFHGFLPKEILLDAINGDVPKVRVVNGRRRVGVEPLFNVHDVMELHKDKPEINPWKLFIDEDKEQWITSEGCTVMLSKKFPNLHPEEVSDAIRQIEAESGIPFDKKIGRVRLFFGTSNNQHLGFAHLFRYSDITEKLVPYLGKN